LLEIDYFIGDKVDDQIKIQKAINPKLTETQIMIDWLDNLSDQNIVQKLADKEYKCLYQKSFLKEAA